MPGDADVGPVLSVGAGGVWVESLRDVAHRGRPVANADVESMLRELKISSILLGHRGGPPADFEAVIRDAQAVASCVLRWPDVAEAEINPLFVYANEVVPVDARVVLGGVGLGRRS